MYLDSVDFVLRVDIWNITNCEFLMFFGIHAHTLLGESVSSRP